MPGGGDGHWFTHKLTPGITLDSTIAKAAHDT